MALNNLQSPDDPNPETSIPDLLKLISAALRRAYRIYSHRPDPDDIEDLTQSIALSLIKKYGHDLRPFEHLFFERKWLLAVAKHAALRFFQGQKDLVSLDDMTPDDFACPPSQEEEVFLEEMNKLLDDLVGELTGRKRQLFELMSQGLDAEEIAQRMGIKVGSVYKARQRFRHEAIRLLESKGDEPNALGRSERIDHL